MPPKRARHELDEDEDEDEGEGEGEGEERMAVWFPGGLGRGWPAGLVLAGL